MYNELTWVWSNEHEASSDGVAKTDFFGELADVEVGNGGVRSDEGLGVKVRWLVE